MRTILAMVAVMALGCAQSAVIPDEPDGGGDAAAVDTRCLDEIGEVRGEEWVCERLTRARVQCEVGGRSDDSIGTPEGCAAASGAWVFRDVIVLCDGVETGCAGHVTVGGYFGACDVGPFAECTGREM